ncbi:hypothetical protein [Mesorhizobium sp. M1E.F.Ca.ET.063.01.1.1]|uniref:hypothetical protein n=1 Tax=Mesorhizobium sp. M1E.F.Ca.ET.063.01.1.1 TaxID=2496750 RepID=UPI000FCAB244|nr:hypothetical protein [Mesorhizobium sp. M1E.F.Ca.ET.063.01.1.1]RUW85202.1 hypothetical protein EOA29_05990 [Mesorhizobium sp. M1E.F.Ca.ET.063.01.1.1]
MYFSVAGSQQLADTEIPHLSLPILSSRGISISRKVRLSTGQFKEVVAFGENAALPLSFIFSKKGPNIEIRVTGLAQEATLKIALLNKREIEIQASGSKRFHFSKCRVECANGEVGSPCVICTQDGHSVRFCC